MARLSFRATEEEADDLQRWAEVLGVARSELLREALRRHLRRLRSDSDVAAGPAASPSAGAKPIADWSAAEDWADWAEAAE
jgi:hypothetical protein